MYKGCVIILRKERSGKRNKIKFHIEAICIDTGQGNTLPNPNDVNTYSMQPTYYLQSCYYITHRMLNTGRIETQKPNMEPEKVTML